MNSDYIYLISNTTDVHINKLTDFKNSVNDLYTRSNGVFEIAISEIIIDDKFISGVTPGSVGSASMILTKRKPNEINGSAHKEISFDEKIIIPHAYYKTQSELCFIIDKQTTPITLWYHNVITNQRFFGYFQNSKSATLANDANQYYLYVYSNLARKLMGEKYKTPSIEVRIENDKYFGFQIDTNGFFFECDINVREFDTYYTPYVIIKTPTISPQYLDDKKVKALAIITLSYDKNRFNRNHILTQIKTKIG